MKINEDAQKEPDILKEESCTRHRFGMWTLLPLHNAILETCSCADCGKSRIRRVRLDETILNEIFSNPSLDTLKE